MEVSFGTTLQNRKPQMPSSAYLSYYLMCCIRRLIFYENWLYSRDIAAVLSLKPSVTFLCKMFFNTFMLRSLELWRRCEIKIFSCKRSLPVYHTTCFLINKAVSFTWYSAIIICLHNSKKAISAIIYILRWVTKTDHYKKIKFLKIYHCQSDVTLSHICIYHSFKNVRRRNPWGLYCTSSNRQPLLSCNSTANSKCTTLISWSLAGNDCSKCNVGTSQQQPAGLSAGIYI